MKPKEFSSTLALLSKRSLSSRIVVNISHILSLYATRYIVRLGRYIYIWHWIPVDRAPQAQIAIHLALINYDRADLILVMSIFSSKNKYLYLLKLLV